MNSEPISSRCPKCQAPLPADAPHGLCPKCLLAAVSAPTDTAPPAALHAAPPLATIAAAFPQLEIVELIGLGGMGAVYKARQPKLDRFVALKILPQSLAADPAFAERFNREARVLARLSHPNIVTVHDFGQSGGFFYLLMEFVDGVNLRQAMQVGRFTPAQALAVVPKICEALQFAHNEGILHRDIKPENILLDTKGRVKIADFGIAKLVGLDAAGRPLTRPSDTLSPSDGEREELHAASDADSLAPSDGERAGVRGEPAALTRIGQALGTPNYMAPEQLEHPQDVDQRADIYSLGVVFYEMLTGELPIGRFAPPSAKSAVDPRVDEVVLRTLEKEREKRFGSAGEVKTRVETIAATSQPGSSRREEAPFRNAEGGVRNAESSQNLVTSAATNSARSRALTPFAWLFIIFGLWSFLDMLFSNGQQNVSIAPSAFCLPIGIGLLRRREACRQLAMWSLWAGFVAMLLMFGWLVGKAFGVIQSPEMVARILGFPISSGAGALLTSLLFLGQAVILPWMYLVLLRDEVRFEFAHSHKKSRPWLEWGVVVLVVLVMVGGVRLPLPNRFQTGVFFTDLKDATGQPTLSTGFGPVIERVLVSGESKSDFLDFDDGQIYSHPTWSMESLLTSEFTDWDSKTGVDFGFFTNDYSQAVEPVAFNLGFFLIPAKWQTETLYCGVSNVWEEANAGRVWRDLQAFLTNREPRLVLGNTNLQGRTMAFYTREGHVGLLQITGFTNHSRGVRIRYKLAKSLNTKSSAQLESATNEAQPDETLTATDYVLTRAWDTSYSVITNIASVEDRWRLLDFSIRTLEDEGLDESTNALRVCEELAWLFLYRLGMDSPDQPERKPLDL